MINPQLFFVKGTISDLRRIAAKYPDVRRLYARKDPLRASSVISVFAALTGNDAKTRTAESTWRTAILMKEFSHVTTLAVQFLAGRNPHVKFIPKGDDLPRSGLGFSFCPTAPEHTAAILLDEMRVMKWCSNMCVPTFGLAKTLADTVLVHVEA